MYKAMLISSKAAEQDGSEGNVLMKQNCTKLDGLLRVEVGQVSQQLLPGIPDEITINLVAPKLPWTEFHKLSSVSRGWQHAIWNHQIYDARVRSQSTQTLLVMNHKLGNDVDALALYSLSDGCSHHLPQFPHVDPVHGKSQLQGYQCISLGSKVYVLGGCRSGEVYMLDIAGQGKWKQCASMQIPRSGFECDVMNAKIYVVGGFTSQIRLLSTSEVYDPESDAWSLIAPKIQHIGFLALLPSVLTLGEELFVYTLGADCAHIYDPLKNQWRIVRQPSPDPDALEHPKMSKMLMVGGKLLRFTCGGTEIYNIRENSWKHSQSFSFGVFGPADSFSVRLPAAVAVDDELLAVVRWTKLHGRYRNAYHGSCLMRSKGLSSQNREIMWQDTQCSLVLPDIDDPQLLCAVQL